MEQLQKDDVMLLHGVIIERVSVFTQLYQHFMDLVENQCDEQEKASLRNQARILCMNMGLIQEGVGAYPPLITESNVQEHLIAMSRMFCCAERYVRQVKNILSSIKD